MKDILGLPQQASFAFTTGCQLAHFTGLAAARYAVLRDADWDVNRDGLFGAPQVRIIANEHRHGSIDRAIRFLGFGSRNMELLKADVEGRIGADALRSKLAESRLPTIVVLDAAASIVVYHDHDRINSQDVQRIERNYARGRGAFYCKHILRGDIFAAKAFYWELRSLASVFIGKRERRRKAVRNLSGLYHGFATRVLTELHASLIRLKG